MFFCGTSISRKSIEGDHPYTDAHWHYSFGYVAEDKNVNNRSRGISFMLRKSRFDLNKVYEATSPHKESGIADRIAMLRYKNGREDICLLGMYFPTKPTNARQKKSIGEFQI